jgi:hypothetical protein
MGEQNRLCEQAAGSVFGVLSPIVPPRQIESLVQRFARIYCVGLTLSGQMAFRRDGGLGEDEEECPIDERVMRR